MLSKALVLKRQAYQKKCNFHFEGCLLWKRKNKPIFHRRDLSWGHWWRCEWWSSFSTFLSQQAFSAWKFLLRRHFFCRRWCPLTWGGPEEALMLHPFFHAPLRKVSFQKCVTQALTSCAENRSRCRSYKNYGFSKKQKNPPQIPEHQKVPVLKQEWTHFGQHHHPVSLLFFLCFTSWQVEYQ